MKTTQTMKFWASKTSEERITFATKIIFRMSHEVRNISAVALGLYSYGLSSDEIQTAFDRQFAYRLGQKILNAQVKLVKEVIGEMN